MGQEMSDRSLLIVDDETELLSSLEQFLSRVGYDVQAASSGSKALEMVVSSPPNMIISDIMMEEMDGFELQKRIEDLYNGTIPFLFLTARGDLNDRLRGLRNGADDYIIKPFDPEELEARIGVILDRVDQVKQDTTQKLLQEESRLLDRVSRELQVPAELLVQELNSTNCPQANCAPMETVKDSAKRLQQQIRELPWSIAETPHAVPVHIQPARIAPIIRSAAASAARVASERNIKFKLTCGGLLAANLDLEAMRKAIGNLLENAVLLAADNSIAHLYARRADDGGIEFEVHTVPASARANDAETLSIATAQSIITAHGGRIELRQTPQSTILVAWIPDSGGHSND